MVMPGWMGLFLACSAPVASIGVDALPPVVVDAAPLGAVALDGEGQPVEAELFIEVAGPAAQRDGVLTCTGVGSVEVSVLCRRPRCRPACRLPSSCCSGAMP